MKGLFHPLLYYLYKPYFLFIHEPIFHFWKSMQPSLPVKEKKTAKMEHLPEDVMFTIVKKIAASGT